MRAWLGLYALVAACASSESHNGTTAWTLGDADATTGGEAGTQSDDAGSGDGGGSTEDAGTACTPGVQVACVCADGAGGTQVCLPDGSGYAPCECIGGPDPGTDSGSEGPAPDDDGNSDDPPPPPPPRCDAAWNCGDCTSCAADCGDCDGCVNCSAFNECEGELGSCYSNAICDAAADCLIGCGYTSGCVDQCTPMDPGAAALFEGATNCLGTVCSSQCAGV